MLSAIAQWRVPPENLTLKSGEVHVWRASLSQSASQVEGLEQILSLDERKRALSFVFEKDRNQFIVARGLLRVVLGRYLSLEPDSLRFRYSLYGKPALTVEFKGDRLRFNLSHSHGVALFVMALDRELGIDVEYIDKAFASEQVANHYFSTREVAMLRELPDNLRPMAFFNCWTRKEAYIKARGQGLSIPLDRFDVSLSPQEPAVLLRVDGDPSETSRWSLRELTPGPGFSAALAVENTDCRPQYWQWAE